MHKPLIAVLGGGNMGFSLIGGIIANGLPSHCITVADPSKTQLHALEHRFEVKVTQDNLKAIQDADVIILAVKPQVLLSVLNELLTLILRNKPLVISIAAGISIASLENIIPQCPIIRAMPNTPALISSGASGLYANSFVSQAQKELAESIIRSVGLVVWVEDEKLIDVITALSGSGPAYIFLMMEYMAKAAVALGLNQDAAKLLAMQTAYGAARMALESADSLADLRKKVTSPGGTTQAAIHAFEAQDFEKVIANAMQAAFERSQALAQG